MADEAEIFHRVLLAAQWGCLDGYDEAALRISTWHAMAHTPKVELSSLSESPSRGPEARSQLRERRDEGLDIAVVVVEVKARTHIVITVRGHDARLHELGRELHAVARAHRDRRAAPRVL